MFFKNHRINKFSISYFASYFALHIYDTHGAHRNTHSSITTHKRGGQCVEEADAHITHFLKVLKVHKIRCWFLVNINS